MNLAKLTHIYQSVLAEKQTLKIRNRAKLTRIASTLQQVSNRQLLQSLGEYLNVTQNL